MKTFNFVSGLDEETRERHSIKRDDNGYYLVPDTESSMLMESKSPIMKDANRVVYALESVKLGKLSTKMFNTLSEAREHLKGALDEHDWDIIPIEGEGAY